MGVMTARVDDRTQVLRVSLKTEAQVLRGWLARRDELAQRRREAPRVAQAQRRVLLEREVPRLEREVAALEKKPAVRAPWAWVLRGLISGSGVALAALGWTAGLVVATPGARLDDPLRLAAMLVVPLVVLGVRR